MEEQQLPLSSYVSSPNAFSNVSSLHLLNLFSGRYGRPQGVSQKVRQLGWAKVTDIDNDGEMGGGWKHDLHRDETFVSLLHRARAGEFDAILIAFPCGTFERGANASSRTTKATRKATSNSAWRPRRVSAILWPAARG